VVARLESLAEEVVIGNFGSFEYTVVFVDYDVVKRVAIKHGLEVPCLVIEYSHRLLAVLVELRNPCARLPASSGPRPLYHIIWRNQRLVLGRLIRVAGHAHPFRSGMVSLTQIVMVLVLASKHICDRDSLWHNCSNRFWILNSDLDTLRHAPVCVDIEGMSTLLIN